MKKIINTLRYGKAKTKTFIISVFVLMVVAIVIGIIGINSMNIIMLGISMVLFIVCIVMVFKLEGATANVDDKEEARAQRSDGGRSGERGARSGRSEEAAPRGGRSEEAAERSGRGEEDAQKSESPETRRAAEEKLIKTLRGKTRGPKTIRAQMERKLLSEIIKANERSAVINKKTYEKRMKQAVKARSGKEPRGEEERTERDNIQVRTAGQEKKTDYKAYTKNEIRRLRKVYKFPKDACRIIIDSCKSLAIDHAPALFWVKKGRINLLIFEESARCETMSMNNTNVSYKKNVREDEIIKYNSMREMGVYKDFEDMMPTFSIHGGAAGNEYYKNLYVIGKDLEVTPRSLRTLMTQFDFKIKIFDSLGVKGNYSEYFQKAYEQRVMWTDGVISQNQYQNNIRDILQSMVDDESIIRYDFMEDLARMVHHRLITDEYAEFYKNKRL
ncbi:MAG: hypothetical protein K6F93_03905 [Lachnospiraceae bacterium]|nr:hypothetical protein [Lachnospiraceae bacterium]